MRSAFSRWLGAPIFDAATLWTGSPLLVAVRHQTNDLHHNYLHQPKVVQPDGLDGLPRVRGEQQLWNNTEQWDGYSDDYLRRFMVYGPALWERNETVEFKNPLLDECLKQVFDLYGTVAEKLHKLHDDPLHPRFHEWIQTIKKDREKIALHLDKVYAPLHPTVKTLYDAFLVRRYYHLGDWITHVERKRQRIFERMTPEYLDTLGKGLSLADVYLERLQKLKTVLLNDSSVGILPEGGDYSEGELAMIRQKATYFRNMRRYGANTDQCDFQPR